MIQPITPGTTISKFSFTCCLGFAFLFLLSMQACQSTSSSENSSADSNESEETLAENETVLSAEEKYELAKKAFEEDENDPDALIWFGRRAAYLGNYEEAISIFSMGIEKHPQDARMLRHRGHRYISTRQYDLAIQDFEKAVEMIQNEEDQVEPDGLPNSRNIPLSTLHSNIWYHLGLAYYLQNDMEKALSAYSNRTVTEKYDDNIVSGGHWLYMILSRLGREEEAMAAISQVNLDMDIIENDSYYQMCLYYKGLIPESDLIADGPGSSSSDVLSYGLGNWYLYKKKDTLKAKEYYKQLLDNGNQYSFAYLAGESDWNRLFQ